ncbi:MAG: methylmalonyl Co-A mutase-associated GTPase MeaB [Thermodesulfovibrionales bacterium]|nr:methylmalonyl Co-A mutase-associated GTPase MeaB [Thermodesulfovibrionales bacterium]
MTILDEAFKGSNRAIGRLISIVENESEGFLEILKKIYPLTGKAKIIGITGPPGVGKSTLVAQIAKIYLRKNKSVGILAVDPSSPISGGSLLGDRIRMTHLPLDKNIFIRSLSSRGTLGGISQATLNVARLLDALGYNIIIIETVGVGQDEVEIINVASTAILVLSSGFGDEIQALKAGVMEVADIFVVNKADHPDTSKYVSTIEKMIHQFSNRKAWTPPIVKTIALSSEGCEELIEKIEEHTNFCKNNKAMLEEFKQKYLLEIRKLVERKLTQELDYFFKEKFNLEDFYEKQSTKNSDPYSIAEQTILAFKSFLKT